jgi:hypothetical protein
MVPVRAAPVLAATLKPTDPLPVPEAPEVIVIHVALLVAVHAHVAPLVTATLPVLAVAGAFTPGCAIVKVHAGAPAAACETVSVRPAMVSVPVRAAPVLAATVNDTAPLPVPFVVDVIVIHGALLTALHAQPACAWISTDCTAAPAAGALTLEGEMLYEH